MSMTGSNHDAVREGRKQLLFLKKSNQKTFAPGGAGYGIAFKRLRWSRFKAIPNPAPPEPKFLAPARAGAFFQKGAYLLTR
jgi:hypothetical protein